MVQKIISEKICSVCNTKKPITAFDYTLSENRRESVCRSCISKQFEPKQPPKTIGKGKPIFGFGGTLETPKEPEYNKYKKKNPIFNSFLKHAPVTEEKVIKEGNLNLRKIPYKPKVDDMKKATDKDNYNKILKYTKEKGDGFTAPEIKPTFQKDRGDTTNIYYILAKLVEKGCIYKAIGKIQRFFVKKENKEYWEEMIKLDATKEAELWNKRILEDIKKGDITNKGEVKKMNTPEKIVKKEEQTPEYSLGKLINEIINNALEKFKKELKQEMLEEITKQSNEIKIEINKQIGENKTQIIVEATEKATNEITNNILSALNTKGMKKE